MPEFLLFFLVLWSRANILRYHQYFYLPFTGVLIYSGCDLATWKLRASTVAPLGISLTSRLPLLSTTSWRFARCNDFLKNCGIYSVPQHSNKLLFASVDGIVLLAEVFCSTSYTSCNANLSDL